MQNQTTSKQETDYHHHFDALPDIYGNLPREQKCFRCGIKAKHIRDYPTCLRNKEAELKAHESGKQEERERIAGISCKYYPNKVVFVLNHSEGKAWNYIFERWFEFLKEANIEIEDKT